MSHRILGCTPAIVLSLVLMPVTARAQMIETETARLPAKRTGSVGSAGEFQTSVDGTESALPVVFEYGLMTNLELLVEPVAYTTIRPDTGPAATGLGDVESTLTWRFGQEHGHAPAMATAFEVKVPTATNEQIGTGKTDFAGYFIMSKRFGKVDTHYNVSYTVIGAPSGVEVNNIYGAAFAAVGHVNERMQIFGEIYGNSSATPGIETADTGGVATGGEGTGVSAELTGSSIVASFGVAGNVRSNVALYGSVGYDNQQAAQARFGFTFYFPSDLR